MRRYHLAMVATWAAYTAAWAASYVLPLPEALFSVKALVGVSLVTALESSFGALHAQAASTNDVEDRA